MTLRLFRIRAFRYICATAFLNMIGLFGAQFMVPIFLQQVMGFTPLQAGLIIVPALILSGLSGVISGRLNDMTSPALMAIVGFAGLSGVFFSFASFTALTTAGVLVGYIIFYRICMFFTITSLTALNVQVMLPEQVRMGQGLMGVVRNIGSSFGVTVTSVLFERRRVTHQLRAYDPYNETSAVQGATLDEVKRYLHQSGMGSIQSTCKKLQRRHSPGNFGSLRQDCWGHKTFKINTPVHLFGRPLFGQMNSLAL